MTHLRAAWKAWDRWWLGDISPHGLAIVRIAVGVFLFGYWLLKLPAVPQLFSNQGVATPLFSRGAPAIILWSLQLPSVAIALCLYVLLLACLLGFALGIRSQVMAAASFALSAYFWALSLHLFGTSFDILFLFFLLAFVFSDSGGTYSLDMRLRHGSWVAWRPVCALTQRLIMLQLTSTYIGVCWQKFVLADWQGGEVLYYNMQSIWATPLAFLFVRLVPWMWVYDVLVRSIEFLQFVIPIGLWVPQLRPFGVSAGIAFHLLILVFLGMGWFLAMLPGYIFFVHPDHVRSALFQRFPSFAGREVR